MGLLTTLDLIIFFGSLLVVMGVGLWAGRKEDTSDDYFLAGHTSKWWGVAGSIFGSNVSANHIIGMMGVGFTVGFAMSHFEISAIFGLLLLCYGFLPVYRKLNVYTLSDYLGRRYSESSRILYAIIMLLVIVVIQMVPGFYIGSRYLNELLKSGQTATAKAVVGEDGRIQEIQVVDQGAGYGSDPQVRIDLPPNKDPDGLARATATHGTIKVETPDGHTVETGAITSIQVESTGAGYDPDYPPSVVLEQGAHFDAALDPGDVDPKWYVIGIILMAVVTGTYTIIGGLKAVIMTDVLQSILMLAAALLVGVLVFNEVGGWTGMLALDAAANGGKDLMHLYKPTNHEGFPVTGVLGGLMVLHFYYWGTNQFIVQRALSARSDREARLGIIVAGFFKLLIPFMSIGGGIAAYYYFQSNHLSPDQDEAFMELMRQIVAPLGWGIVGLVAAGVVGAILSSVDSMLNSGATIMTFDVYQRYINPQANERSLVWMGRLWVVIFIAAAAVLTIFTMDPNDEGSFFIRIATHQSFLIAGVVVAFALGMFWKRASAVGATVAIVVGVVASYGLPVLYNGNFEGAKIFRGYTGTATVQQFDDSVLKFFPVPKTGPDGTPGEPNPGIFSRHFFHTGDAVRFAGAKELPAAKPAIVLDKPYFVHALNETEITLHTSLAQAESGKNPIRFVTAGQGEQRLYLGSKRVTVSWWGAKLNFMHSVFLAALIAMTLQILISLFFPAPDDERRRLTWTELGGHSPGACARRSGNWPPRWACSRCWAT